MRFIMKFLCLTVLMSLSSASVAATPEPVQQHNSNAVWFENWIGLSNATMKVQAPDGSLISVLAVTGTPVFQLSGNEVQDGVYRFELSAATDEKEKIVNPIDNGRGENASDMVSVSFSMEGRFVVARGVIVTPKDIQEER